MDSVNPLTTVDAKGGLLAFPCIRFNKDGTLLAVSTVDNGVRALANADGFRLLRNMDNHAYDPSRVASGSAVNPPPTARNFSTCKYCSPSYHWGPDFSRGCFCSDVQQSADGKSLVDVKPRADELMDKPKVWKLPEIDEPSQCRSLKLPDTMSVTRISRLIYINTGFAILALASNVVHKLWKWHRSEQNVAGKATASILPQLWQPASGILMTNDLSDTNPKGVVSCFALSKNDSYVMSASGGKYPCSIW